jgi:hypothetical protein
MSTDPLARVRRELRAQLRERVDARGLSAAPRTERRLRVREEALTLMRESGALLPQRDLARVVNEVSDEVVGFGPIEFLLKDPDVTEVVSSGPEGIPIDGLLLAGCSEAGPVHDAFGVGVGITRDRSGLCCGEQRSLHVGGRRRTSVIGLTRSVRGPYR